jgi:uncharacterized protein YkwD
VNVDGMVLDASDEIIGYVDLGKGTLKDRHQSHFATVQSDGTILDKNELNRGSLRNFTYHKLKIFASYIFFFDSQLVEDRLSTKVTSPGADAGVDTSSISSFSEEDSMSKEEARLLRHVKGAHAAPSAPKHTTAAAPKQAAAAPKPVVHEPAKPVAAAAPKPVAPTGPIVEAPAPALSDDAATDDRGLVHNADEKARREAERMNKAMGGQAFSPAASSKPQLSQHDIMASQYPVPIRPEVKSKYEVELWTEINRARTSPAELIKALEATKPNYQGNNYNFPGTHTTRVTKEGISGVDQAIAFLKSQSSLSPIALSDGLSLSSKDLVSLAASSKQFDNLETDEQGSARFNRYGKWSGKLFQNLALGNLSPAEVVLNWIIDDGNTNRDHRHSIFNPEINFVGIASGPHIEFSRTTVACFTSKFIENSENAASSSSAASASSSSSSSAASDDIPVVSSESEYKVGPLTDAGDKYYLDISNLGCPANGLQVKLLDNGKSLTVTRTVRVNGIVKEAVQRMKLPFQVSAHQFKPVFASVTGILTLNLHKAVPSGSTVAFHIGDFTVPAWAGNTNDKVNVQATSSSDAYVFICEPSKHLTKVAVSIDAEKKLTFDMQYTFDTVVEGQPATKTVKMSSQFGLPFDVAPEQVSVSPNGEKGSSVKILKTRPSVGESNIPDTVIPIQVQ